MTKNKLSKRLLAAAEECREGSFIADVGTDHALLPVYLAREGKIRGAVASDINKGPIERAKLNIGEAGLSDKIQTVLCNGLTGIEKYKPDDIFILGMGGELIAWIIGQADFLKSKGKRLILGPMTHPEILRKSLLSGGFHIVKEKLVHEDKLYQIIVAEFLGRSLYYTDAELLLGKLNIEQKHPLLPMLIEKNERVLRDIIKGKNMAGESAEKEERLLAEIGAIKSK